MTEVCNLDGAALQELFDGAVARFSVADSENIGRGSGAATAWRPL